MITKANATDLVTPWTLGVLIDNIGDKSAIMRVVVMIGLTTILSNVLTTLGVTLITQVGETVLARIREQMLDRVLQLPAPILKKIRTGDLLSQINNDMATIASALTEIGPSVLGATLTIMLTVGGMFALDWRLGLTNMLAVPMYYLALHWYLQRSAPYYKQKHMAMGERSKTIIASLHNSQTVRAYRLENRQLAKIEKTSNTTRNISINMFRLFNFFSAQINHAEFTGLTTILITNFFLIQTNAISMNTVTATALYFHHLFNPINVVLMEFDQIQTTAAKLSRLASVLEIPPAPKPPASPDPADASLELQGISHHYDGPEILTGISLRFEPGEQIALIGANNTKKTTLTAVAANILTPSNNTIKLNNVDLQTLKKNHTRQQVALLSQKIHVFSGTLMENVQLARPKSSPEKIKTTLKQIKTLAWIRALPKNLNTMVGENGHQLTNAQTQQLAFAKLVLADPPITILNKTTAKADSTNARELKRASTAATAGRTTLVVAHQLTQAEQTNRIVILNQKQMVESETHETLLTTNNRYAQLWRS